MRKVLIGLGLTVAVALLGAAGFAGYYVWDNTTAFDRRMDRVERAGYVERQVAVDGQVVNYAEGPPNGPALLLIHGQSVDWKNYAAVLPDLAQRYHVFAVDAFGHGSSAHDPSLYSGGAHGRLLSAFVDEVIGADVLVSGHSSGGHLAALVTGRNPHVRGVLLEDPPFFTTTLPRAETTWNYVDLATTAHEFLVSGESDWVRYSMERMRMWSFFGDSAEMFRQQARDHLAAHPEGPVVWAWLPPVMNESVRAMPDYDPRFGDAFYTGDWDADWDQAEVLASIAVPATLVHTKVQYDTDGTLMGAMGHEEAARARGLLRDVVFEKVETGHGFHDEAPKDFIRMVDALRVRAGV